MANDYAIINDSRDSRDIRVIVWLAPPMMMQDARAKGLLDNYVVVGVVRAHLLAGGAMSLDTINTLQATDGNAKPLRLLKGDDIPPTVNGMVAAMASTFGQSMGAFGKGFRLFVFEAGTVRACKNGSLSIPFANEIYTYQTPFPGCSPQ